MHTLKGKVIKIVIPATGHRLIAEAQGFKDTRNSEAWLNINKHKT